MLSEATEVYGKFRENEKEEKKLQIIIFVCSKSLTNRCEFLTQIVIFFSVRVSIELKYNF